MLNFHIIKEIGRGSYGSCVLARARRTATKLHTSLPSNNTTFVIKKIAITNIQEKQDTKNEIKLLSNLKNEYIITYYCYFYDTPSRSMCIAMEHAGGGDLGAKIKRQRSRRKLFSTKQIKQWFKQIATAINYCHSHNVLHRDLKPANIFLSTDGTIKIGDFGIAVQLNSTGSFAKTVIGTPTYMAPEIIREEKYNHMSDVWSLGCVLYEMCTLKPAFNGRNMKMLVLKIVRGNKKPLHKSCVFKTICDQMLHTKFQNRIQLNLILQNKLFTNNDSSHSKKGHVEQQQPKQQQPRQQQHQQHRRKSVVVTRGLSKPKLGPPKRRLIRKSANVQKLSSNNVVEKVKKVKVKGNGRSIQPSKKMVQQRHPNPLAVFNAGWAKRREAILNIAGINKVKRSIQPSKTPQSIPLPPSVPSVPVAAPVVIFSKKSPPRSKNKLPVKSKVPKNMASKQMKRHVLHQKGLGELRAMYLANKNQKNQMNQKKIQGIPGTVLKSVLQNQSSMNTNNNDNSTNVQMGIANVASKYQIKSKKSLKKKTRIELKREAREEARKKMRLEIAKRKKKQKKQMKNGKQETINIVFVQDKYKNVLSGASSVMAVPEDVVVTEDAALPTTSQGGSSVFYEVVVAPSAPTAPSTAQLPPSPPKMNPNEINQNGMEETLSGIVYMSDSDSFEDSSSDEFETTIAVPDWPMEFNQTIKKSTTNSQIHRSLESSLKQQSTGGRIELLRLYLEQQLGDTCLIESYRLLSNAPYPLEQDALNQLHAILNQGKGDINNNIGDVENANDLVPLLRRMLVLETSMY